MISATVQKAVIDKYTLSAVGRCVGVCVRISANMTEANICDDCNTCRAITSDGVYMKVSGLAGTTHFTCLKVSRQSWYVRSDVQALVSRRSSRLLCQTTNSVAILAQAVKPFCIPRHTVDLAAAQELILVGPGCMSLRQASR